MGNLRVTHLLIAAGSLVAGRSDSAQVYALIHTQLPQGGGQTDLLDEVRQGLPTGRSDEEVAAAGVEALADFIKEIGLPTTLRELGVDESVDLGAVAASCNKAPGSYKKMCHAEIAQIFQEAY